MSQTQKLTPRRPNQQHRHHLRRLFHSILGFLLDLLQVRHRLTADQFKPISDCHLAYPRGQSGKIRTHPERTKLAIHRRYLQCRAQLP
jgi:hypothetical protein